MKIYREWGMPNSETFKIIPIRRLLEKEIDLNLMWIDPFARDSHIATITNDINPNCKTDYHLDALEFLNRFEDNSVDGVLYDPPYSPRQLKECYDNIGKTLTSKDTTSAFWSNIKKAIARIVKKDGKVISFGWNSGGIGKNLGFEIETILLVPHGGIHNDTIVTVERKLY